VAAARILDRIIVPLLRRWTAARDATGRASRARCVRLDGARETTKRCSSATSSLRTQHDVRAPTRSDAGEAMDSITGASSRPQSAACAARSSIVPSCSNLSAKRSRSPTAKHGRSPGRHGTPRTQLPAPRRRERHRERTGAQRRTSGRPAETYRFRRMCWPSARPGIASGKARWTIGYTQT